MDVYYKCREQRCGDRLVMLNHQGWQTEVCEDHYPEFRDTTFCENCSTPLQMPRKSDRCHVCQKC